MKKQTIMLLFGVLLLFGGNLDTVSNPLVDNENIVQVGDLQVASIGDVTTIKMDNQIVEYIEKARTLANHYNFPEYPKDVAIKATFVRNKSSGNIQPHDGISKRRNDSIRELRHRYSMAVNRYILNPMLC